jgi:hypothetical protein
VNTYADLQTSIKNWLRRSDLDSVIPDFITLGEQRIYRGLRVRQMEEEIDSTISGGLLPVPSDYVDMKYIYVDNSTKQWLERKSAEWIYRNNPTRNTDTPLYFARERDNFIFAPSQDVAVKGTYYKRLPSISVTLNDIFTGNSGLWLFAALCETAPYIQNDARLPVWEKKFMDILMEVNTEEFRENASGSRLAMTAE